MGDKFGNKAKRARTDARKQPLAVEAVPSTRKQPRAIEPSATTGNLSWRLGLMSWQREDRWSWGAMTRDEAQEFQAFLSDMERHSWDTAAMGYKPRLKLIPVANLSSDARRELERRRLDDFADEHLWELHQDGKTRIWGIRDNHVFRILWWDPEHEVCPSKLRNT